MSVDRFDRRRLVHQAERIERVLSSLALPVKIQGGQIEEGRIRYHLAPSAGIFVQRLSQLAKKVAEEMGVYGVHVTESNGGLILDLPTDECDGVQLVPLLESLGATPPFTAVFGVDAKRNPFRIDFRQPGSRHLIITGGPRTGKSEFLRSVLLSIALSSRQTQVNFLGIDLSGNELSVVEALPHAMAEVATDSQYGLELMQWLIDEIERREVFHIRYPELFLLIDDLDELIDEKPAVLKMLVGIITEGMDTGVHVVATSRASFLPKNESLIRISDVVKAKPLHEVRPGSNEVNVAGRFRIYVNRNEYTIRVAWLPALDLQEVVNLIHAGKNLSDAGLDSGNIQWC